MRFNVGVFPHNVSSFAGSADEEGMSNGTECT